MKLIWIASYPKSGNTWLRFFLYSYYYGIPMNSRDINKKIPDIHTPNKLDENLEKRVFSKTHFLNSNQHPHFANTLGSIYIIRHPKDVLLSNLNYFRLTGHTQIDQVEFARSFIKHKGLPIWQQAGMGSWPEHVASWKNNSQMPQFFIKYEELKSDPEKYFFDIINFLDNDVDSKKLDQALLRSSFENMRRIENNEKKKNKFGEVFWGNTQTAKQGIRFLNKGGVNQKLKHIDPALDEEFDKAFENELKMYGYS